MTWIRKPRRGDEDAIARLGAIALGEPGAHERLIALGKKAAAVHGKIRVPHGSAYALVGGIDPTDGVAHDAAMEGRPVAGFIYATPPVRLIDEHADLGQSVQQHMARRLAEIELLAVESRAQGRGLGSALLAEMENNLRQRGVGVVLVKIRASISTIRWYLQRGYTLADLTAPTLLRLGGNVITCGDGADGHRLALKPLRNQPVHDATTVFRP